jgi:hypothetical protein
MIRKLAFDEVVEAVDRLSAEEKSDLLHLLQRRLADQERSRLAADIKEARAEFAAGKAKLLDIDALTAELQ